jgi:hypothetical protein
MSQLTPHFSLHELVRSDAADRNGIDNVPTDPRILANLLQTAQMLERIRAALNCPILISSGYRSEALNTLVGGQGRSDHMDGLAVDWRAPAAGSPLAIARRLEPLVDRLQIGQLIYENLGAQWIHTGVPVPRKKANRVITITRNGVTVGING